MNSRSPSSPSVERLLLQHNAQTVALYSPPSAQDTASAMTNNDLFSEFPPISKADWIRQITKDLKDKPLEDLRWHLPNGVAVSPFVHADDFDDLPNPLSSAPNAWELCETLLVDDLVMANRQALEALEGGAEGLCFQLEQALDFAAFGQLLQGIHLDFIGLHFAGTAVSQNPGMVLANLEHLARQRGIDTALLRGSLAYNPVPVSKIVDWRYLADLITYADEKFPGFKLITCELSERGLDVQHANQYLQKLSERGISVEKVAAVMQFSVALGKSYFFEIAKLRAIKLVWLNVLKAWNAPLQMPVLSAHFQEDAYTDDLYTNMIRATTMAMSAVQGGVSRLSILPYDAGREAQATYPAAFGRRIARNVQHLLKMESGQDEVPDPAAGSYYIETLTRQLAEKMWAEMGQ